MNHHPNGMRAFLIVWTGQFASLIGTAMTTFAMTLWAYETTGKATPLAMINFCFMVPIVLFGPVTGVLIDRCNRKLMMMVSDLAAAVSSLILLALLLTNTLEVWHLYITAILNGTFQGFQWPAYSAAISLMLPKKHYGRASGLMTLAKEGSLIFAPIMAGVLIGMISLKGILMIDLISVVIVVITLLVVKIPEQSKKRVDNVTPHFFKEALLGFQYILTKPSLLLLQCIFLMGNFFFNLAYVLIAPMFGNFIGVGKCSGIALLFVISGLMVAITGFSGYFIHYVRKVECIIPDHQLIRVES